MSALFAVETPRMDYRSAYLTLAGESSGVGPDARSSRWKTYEERITLMRAPGLARDAAELALNRCSLPLIPGGQYPGCTAPAGVRAMSKLKSGSCEVDFSFGRSRITSSSSRSGRTRWTASR